MRTPPSLTKSCQAWHASGRYLLSAGMDCTVNMVRVTPLVPAQMRPCQRRLFPGTVDYTRPT